MTDESKDPDFFTVERDTEEQKRDDDDEIVMLTKGKISRLWENAKAIVTDEAVEEELDRRQKLDEERAITELDPAFRATRTICKYAPHSLREADGIRQHLEKLLEPIRHGNLDGVKKMLASQIFSLDAVGHSLLQGSNVFCVDIKKAEPWLRLGLKAFSQSRAAAEALNEMVNPSSVAFVQQQNIAQQQQVNNGRPPKKVKKRQAKDVTPTRARKSKNASSQGNKISSNKLLLGDRNEKLDFRSKRTPGKANSEMEALGKIKRPKNERRQSQGKQKRI